MPRMIETEEEIVEMFGAGSPTHEAWKDMRQARAKVEKTRGVTCTCRFEREKAGGRGYIVNSPTCAIHGKRKDDGEADAVAQALESLTPLRGLPKAPNPEVLVDVLGKAPKKCDVDGCEALHLEGSTIHYRDGRAWWSDGTYRPEDLDAAIMRHEIVEYEACVDYPSHRVDVKVKPAPKPLNITLKLNPHIPNDAVIAVAGKKLEEIGKVIFGVDRAEPEKPKTQRIFCQLSWCAREFDAVVKEVRGNITLCESGHCSDRCRDYAARYSKIFDTFYAFIRPFRLAKRDYAGPDPEGLASEYRWAERVRNEELERLERQFRALRID